jgi:uncharacterized 2Fe-2S/4Fe-4S cluster protein (DUF4445 family)
MMAKCQVVFQPAGRRGEVEIGRTLLEAAQELGVAIEANCGGAKSCGKCKVIIEAKTDSRRPSFSPDHVSPLSGDERDLLTETEIKAGYRLACVAQITGDLPVTVPEESRGGKQVVLETGKDRELKLNPAVRLYTVTLTPASLEDPAADYRRLINALEKEYGLSGLWMDPLILRDLASLLRKNKWSVSAVVRQDREIIRVASPDSTDLYGVAVDVGTTTLAAYLCNLKTGEVLGKTSKMNPQIAYGEDILSRISYTMEVDGGLDTLQRLIIVALNELTETLCAGAGISPVNVDEMVLVFNTVMHHIALGINPTYVGRIPFAPVVSDPLDIKARDLGININPAGNVHALPVEAGFVGPDNVGVLIAEEPYKKDEIQLIIDIGTNGEIDFGNKKKMFSTSCATGPALEGAQIKFGMRAAPGAIEKVQIDTKTLELSYKVIGSDQWYPELKHTGAKGICGSGIIDVIAVMFKAGLILPNGRLNKEAETSRMRKNGEGKFEYVVAWAAETDIDRDIVIAQGDIRAVQLAKAAIYVGAKYLMEKYGAKTIERVVLAGAFGSYIDKENAMIIGLFPDCDLDKVEAVGNAAGDGSRMALLDRAKREEASWVARNITFVETAVEADFQKRFMAAMAFPHSEDQFPHLAPILAHLNLDVCR